MNKFSSVFFTLLFISSCSDNKKTINPLISNQDSVTSAQSIYGTYSGEISCDDCESVVLTIMDNHHYSLTIHLIGEEKSSQSTIKEEGIYTWNADKTILSLDKFNFKFKVDHGKLYYLDHNITINEDEVLIKK
ncbi:copper resistance protein NlpE N-terminal domain-containing protein [Apibacter sp. HY039]|uniref:copper resistance protein NlpE N-terminal domain-containing protein n=1 Tax=Apibacter sp. HY039 TaxID=2501476 RepID=UPI000FEBCE3F|nr:copper resistance protein NlpE N-terminal domain-containing protein [Apibacter sp. HY039]